MGTFVRVTLSGSTPAVYEPLWQELTRWLAAARRAGLDDETVEAMFGAVLRQG